MTKVLKFIVAVLGVVASIVGIAVAPRSFWCWWYPLPLIVLLAVALAGSWAYFLLSRRGPSKADQERLDRLFRVLPRQAVRRIEDADFHAGWKRDVNWPVSKFVYDMDAPEDRFDNRKLESARRRLYEKAFEFDGANATHGFPARGRNQLEWRDTGSSAGELEMLPPEQLAQAEERAVTIASAARETVEAHDALVKAARRRGFNLDALASDAPEYPGGKK